MNGGREESLPPLVCSSICGMATLVCSQWWSFKDKGPLGVNFSSKSVLEFLFDLTFTIVITDFQTGPHFRKQSLSICYQKCQWQKHVLLNEYFTMKNIEKDSDSFWRWKLTLKVIFRHCFWQSICKSSKVVIVKYFSRTDF